MAFETDISWPNDLPNPVADQLSWNAGLGLSSTKMAGGNIRLRRFWKNLPQMFALSFQLTTDQMTRAVAFLNEMGSGWFNVPLVSIYSGLEGSIARLTPVRVTSNINVEAQGFNYWKLSFNAEISDSAYAYYFGTPDNPVLRVWIVGGTPANPSPSWVIAGSPANPSPDYVIPGSPENPSVTV
jgi:hypothetical protein